MESKPRTHKPGIFAHQPIKLSRKQIVHQPGTFVNRRGDVVSSASARAANTAAHKNKSLHPFVKGILGVAAVGTLVSGMAFIKHNQDVAFDKDTRPAAEFTMPAPERDGRYHTLSEYTLPIAQKENMDPREVDYMFEAANHKAGNEEFNANVIAMGQEVVVPARFVDDMPEGMTRPFVPDAQQKGR